MEHASATPGAWPTPVRHVIIVFLENEPTSVVLAKGPYEKQLASSYAYASQYYAVSHPSAPNYLAATAGSMFDNSGTDDHHVYDAMNVADLFEKHGLSWGAFAEDMPKPCDTQSSGLYDVSHEPFLYYQDIVDNPARCDSHVTGFSQWDADVASGSIPNYAFITPNLDHDGDNTGVPTADAWLKGWLAPLLEKSWFSTTVVFVVYDESFNSDTSGYGGLHGGHVYMVAAGPLVKKSFTFSTEACDYDLLTTVEWLFGLGSTGHADANLTRWPPMRSLFNFSS